MLARSADRLTMFEQKIAAAGGIARGRPTDVRDERQVVELFEQVATEHGRIDAAIVAKMVLVEGRKGYRLGLGARVV